MFKVGDVVEIFGAHGVVTEVTDKYTSVLINGRHVDFSPEGRFPIDWAVGPSLALVARPKRKITKTIEGYVYVDSKGQPGQMLYKNKQPWVLSEPEQFVKITGTYEVEE
jgi:hypothetical protein